jgi:fatty acid desaturase
MNLSVDEQIYRLPKAELRSRTGGVSYPEFKRLLRPRYGVVWRDILVGYAALVVLMALMFLAQRTSPWLGAISLLPAALLFGYAFAYLNLFFHEAAHRNLAADPAWSDCLADWFVGIFFGQSIAAYRVVHFGHHQHHGTPLDSEHSYFDPCNMRFILGSIFGVRAFRVARQRGAISEVEPSIRRAARVALLRGMFLNGTVVLTTFFTGHWMAGVAWALGMLSVFPFFNALRQLLEHRDELASDHSNYSEIAHGRINRLFGDSLLAQTLGGAGFNRHLLHHWEPQLSYTRLKELEEFVLDCDCAPLFRQKQTTYSGTFFRLFRGARS